jgi:hypothetical protein
MIPDAHSGARRKARGKEKMAEYFTTVKFFYNWKSN